MPTRADVLGKFGLPDRAAFEMTPARDPHGLWRIKVGYENGAPIHVSLGHAAKLADAIRSVDHGLAEQLDACALEARRVSERSK